MSIAQQSKFWDETDPADFREGDFPPFMSKAETAALLESGDPMAVIGVREGTIRDKDVLYVDVRLAGDTERTKTFDVSVRGRTKLLQQIRQWLEGGGDPVPVRFAEWGKAIGLEPADGAVAASVQNVSDTDLEEPGEGGDAT